MKEMIYTIINIPFRTNFAMKDGKWEIFISNNSVSSCFSIQLLTRDFNEMHALEYFTVSSSVNHIIRCGNDIMLSDITWENTVILPLYRQINLPSFLCQCFYSHAVQKRILYLHSSLLAYQKRGLMFLGPSGIGKTTQAELWNKYRDALIINGDVVFVQETEDAFLGWGTPWHGSSPYCENTSVPVSALIVLKQAEENSIRELTGFEKVTAVSESVFYPRWLENGMELCLETLDHLLSRLPVYELSCRPDEDAVRLVEETVFGK